MKNEVRGYVRSKVISKALPLPKVVDGVKFNDGIEVVTSQNQTAAA